MFITLYVWAPTRYILMEKKKMLNSTQHSTLQHYTTLHIKFKYLTTALKCVFPIVNIFDMTVLLFYFKKIKKLAKSL